ncbi:hypothetical protein D3C87_1802250 [compost metagenome]
MQHLSAERDAQLLGEMANENPAEQDPANAKPNTTNFDIANPQPNHRHQGQHANR